MKTKGILLTILFIGMLAACQDQKDAKTVETTTQQEDDKKVKFKLDGKEGKLEVETDKVDVELE